MSVLPLKPGHEIKAGDNPLLLIEIIEAEIIHGTTGYLEFDLEELKLIKSALRYYYDNNAWFHMS